MNRKDWRVPGPSAEDRAHRPIVCPHGSGLPCSQCLGFVARKVRYDEVGQVMLVDNEVVRESLGGHDAESKRARDRQARGMKNRTRRQPSCSLCGVNGHTRQKCPR